MIPCTMYVISMGARANSRATHRVLRVRESDHQTWRQTDQERRPRSVQRVQVSGEYPLKPSQRLTEHAKVGIEQHEQLKSH